MGRTYFLPIGPVGYGPLHSIPKRYRMSLCRRLFGMMVCLSLFCGVLFAQESPPDGAQAQIVATLNADNSLKAVVELLPPAGRRPLLSLMIRRSQQPRDITVDALQSHGASPVTYELVRQGPFWILHWPAMAETGLKYRIGFVIPRPVEPGPGGDLLNWDVVSAAHDFSFRSIQTTLALPGGPESIKGVPVLHTAAHTLRVQTVANGLALEAADLPPRSYLKLELHLKPGTVAHAFDLGLFMVTTGGPVMQVGLPILALLGLSLLFWLRGRDPQLQATDPAAPSAPETLPEIAGTVVDEYTDGRDIVAAAVDLARQGFIRFIFTPATGATPSSVTVKELKSFDGLPFWRRALAQLLTRQPDPGNPVALSVENRLPRQDVLALQADIQKEASREGFFRSTPAVERRNYRVVGLSLLAAGLLVVCVDPQVQWLFQCGSGLLLAGLPFFLFAPLMPQRTVRGAGEKARILAYRQSLVRLDPAGMELDTIQSTFEEGLAYAIALRYRKEWIARFAEVGAPSPQWFHLSGAPADGDPGTLREVSGPLIKTLSILSLSFGDAPLEGAGG